MSLSSFLVWMAIYVVLVGAISGGVAAWTARAGSSSLREIAAAFRARTGSRR